VKIQNLPLPMVRTSSKSFSESLERDTETQGTFLSLFYHGTHEKPFFLFSP